MNRTIIFLVNTFILLLLVMCDPATGESPNHRAEPKSRFMKQRGIVTVTASDNSQRVIHNKTLKKELHSPSTLKGTGAVTPSGLSGKRLGGNVESGRKEGSQYDQSVPPVQDDSHQRAQVSSPVVTGKGSETGLPLPRFVSLRSDQVNLRVGPGRQFPIQLIYQRRGLPVKIEREFDVWRLIEDWKGNKGWVHQATLVTDRTFIIDGDTKYSYDPGQLPLQNDVPPYNTVSRISAYLSDPAAIPLGSVYLRKNAFDTAAPVAVLSPGVVGIIKECKEQSQWCFVSVSTQSGWLRRDQFWGGDMSETVSISQ